MPQPDEIGQYIDPLIEAYRTSWRRVVDEELAMVLDPRQATKRNRLAEVRRAIEREMAYLDANAREWIQSQFPKVYAAGAVTSLAQVPTASSFIWTRPHIEAVQRLADGLYHDLLQATKHVNNSTKALVRAVARDRLLAKAIEGKTAKQAGREMARILGDRGIYGMVYSNGARHSLAAYSEMAIRTVSGTAYNEGSLNAPAEEGVKYWEVFDGIGCGWEFHSSVTPANGKIVTVDEARSYPLSHPNCRRGFGPRPDIVTKTEAKKAAKTASLAQDRAQLDSQLARGEKVVLSRSEANKLGAAGFPGVTIR